MGNWGLLAIIGVISVLGGYEYVLGVMLRVGRTTAEGHVASAVVVVVDATLKKRGKERGAWSENTDGGRQVAGRDSICPCPLFLGRACNHVAPRVVAFGFACRCVFGRLCCFDTWYVRKSE